VQLTVAHNGSYCPSSSFRAAGRQTVCIVVQHEAVFTGDFNDCTVCRVAVALKPMDNVERWTYASLVNEIQLHSMNGHYANVLVGWLVDLFKFTSLSTRYI